MRQIHISSCLRHAALARRIQDEIFRRHYFRIRLMKQYSELRNLVGKAPPNVEQKMNTYLSATVPCECHHASTVHNKPFLRVIQSYRDGSPNNQHRILGELPLREPVREPRCWQRTRALFAVIISISQQANN